MQTRDAVEGLPNFREFSQPLMCLDVNTKKELKVLPIVALNFFLYQALHVRIGDYTEWTVFVY